jgi:predicted CopG family antitoxin
MAPCLRALFVYYQFMATITLTVTTEVHDKLKKLKVGKESFSEMLLRELPDRANTCGEVLEKLEGRQLPPMDPNLPKAVRSGRGRRPNGHSRHAR